MSRSSAFARVIGLTKSLSPLGFDRNEAAPEDRGTEAADALVRQAEGGALIGVGASVAVEPFMQPTNVVMAFPALAQVTVVQEAPPALSPAADPAVPSEGPAGSEAITADAINSIEQDIASILATLEREEHAAVDDHAADNHDADDADDGDWLPPVFDDAEAVETARGDEPVGALLSELNRLWQAEPDLAAQQRA